MLKTKSGRQILNWINGKKIPPLSGEYLSSENPATGEVYAQVPRSQKTDIDQAVDAAHRAFVSWSRTSAEERAKILYNIADLIEENLESLAQAESEDQGKPVYLAQTMDIPRAAENFRFFAGAILHRQNHSTQMEEGFFNYEIKKPVGVAGLISPWNLPLYLLTWKIAPALAAGNTCVCKPSELTSMTAFLLTDLLEQSGLPPGVCNMVFGTGQEAGQALVAHKDVPLISFTGGTATAESIIKTAAPHFKKLSLELGGKNPNIVFADGDFEKAIEGSLRSSFLNQGEICLCGSRIFVESKIYEKFVKSFVEQTKKLKVGDPKSKDNFMGPVVSEAHYKKILHYIELAKKEGGQVLTGGPSSDSSGFSGSSKLLEGGYFIDPTVITDLRVDCSVMQEEIFGPVVTITPFSSEKEVLEYANGTPYGLAASVWTSNLQRAHKMGRELESGIVWVNTWLKRDLRTPFGGVKASGIGREGGEHSLDFFTEVTNVCINYN